MSLTIDLEARTLTGTTKGDGINWRQYGLVWSGRQSCWVWARTTRPETVELRASQIERDHGAEIVGRAQPIDVDPDERDERIAERHERSAAAATAEADRRLGAAHATLDHIPLGQPIITGRGSRTTADINRRNRAHANMGRGFEAMQHAEDEARLADGARRRIETRAVQREAEPAPRDLITPGCVIEWWGTSGARRRRYTVSKVNRLTITWAEHGCSGKREIDRIFAVWGIDGTQLWPVPP